MADQPFQRLRRFLAELKRRKVYRVAAGYLVAAFVVLQLADLAAGAFGFPGWFQPMVWVLAGLGFPIAVVLAWAFEVTPEGVRRTPEAEPTEEAAAGGGEGLSTGYKVLVGLGLVAAAVAGGWYLTGGGGTSSEVSQGTVAVLPFEVSGSGADDWRGAMVSLLSTNLDGAGGIRTIADRTVFAALEEEGSTPGGTSTEEALAVARGIGAEYAVVGSASQLGGELQLTARLHKTASGDRLEQVTVRGPADSITSLTDSLTRRILAVIMEEGQEIPSVDLASLTTRSVPALKSFLAGERDLRAGEYEAAIEDYQAAVGADNTFALAHLRLGRAQSWSLRFGARERSWARAYELSDRLPERERGVARAAYLREQGRLGAAADTLHRLAERYSDDPIVWYNLAESLWHGFVPGGWPEADTAFRRAIELDPRNAIYYPHHIQLAVSVHDDSALAAERIASVPDPKWRAIERIMLDLAYGDDVSRRRALARLDTVEKETVFRLGPWHALRPPVHDGALEKMLGKIQEWGGRPGRLATSTIARARIGSGRVESATSTLTERGLPALTECVLARSMSVGIPVPDSLARRHLDPASLPEDAIPIRSYCSAIYLIERGQTEKLGPLLARIRENAGTESEARRYMDEVRGFRAWKGGDLQRAERLWRGWNESNAWGAIWRGDLYRELGELEKAVGWYRAGWPHPLAHERLGQLFKEMGKPEKAAAAYRRFIAAWKNADPELQPRVEAARQRLKELTGSQAEANE